MRIPAWLVCGTALIATGAQPARADRFARHAIGVADILDTTRPKTIGAPNGRTRAIARFTDWGNKAVRGSLTVFLGGDDHRFPGGEQTELLWAPDSRALAVTADDESDAADADSAADRTTLSAGRGAASADDMASSAETPRHHFTLTLLVRRPRGRHWRRIEISERIEHLFAAQMRCPADIHPDVAALGWTSGQRLIAVAQVPAGGGCRNAGHYAGYIVDTASGAVLMDLSPALLHRRYDALLGTALATRAHHHRRR